MPDGATTHIVVIGFAGRPLVRAIVAGADAASRRCTSCEQYARWLHAKLSFWRCNHDFFLMPSLRRRLARSRAAGDESRVQAMPRRLTRTG
jgi:hypothetical protein